MSTIAAFVKEYGITHIILGRSRQPWYRRWFGQSLLDRLLQTVSGVDVIVLDAEVIGRPIAYTNLRDKPRNTRKGKKHGE